MKVQIISDIHLENYSNNFRNFKKIIEPQCDILFLAGDIGNINHGTYRPFLNYVSENWKEIYYVLGNHEYYSFQSNSNKINTYENLLLEYRELILEYWNINLLTENEDYIYHIWNKDDGILYFILGNTGWTFSNYNDTEIKTQINDSNYIYTNIKYNTQINNSNNLIMNINNKWFINKHLECLKNIELNYTSYKKFEKMHEIEDMYSDKIKDVKFICLTHFPFAEFEKVSHYNYHTQNKRIKDYFCNDYYKYKKLLGYDIFIAGHTHYSYDYNINNSNVRFISNQKGYTDDLKIMNKNYNTSCLFDIE